VTAQLAGTANLVATLHTAAGELADLKDANGRASQLITASAAAAAPRRTGRLASTGQAATADGRAVITFGGNSARYAPVIHWGWPKRHIRPREFASHAAQRTEPQWIEFYRTDVETAIDRVQGV
jgi:hypothetical protein